MLATLYTAKYYLKGRLKGDRLLGVDELVEGICEKVRAVLQSGYLSLFEKAIALNPRFYPAANENLVHARTSNRSSLIIINLFEQFSLLIVFLVELKFRPLVYKSYTLMPMLTVKSHETLHLPH